MRTGWACARWGGGYLAGLPRAGRPTDESFTYDGASIPYLRHRYNWTWLNERAVEVPLALGILGKAADGARVLEVGNVLGHYGAVGHTVVDRYERAPGVINEDVAAFDPGDERFDLIVSVSTLEHVGFDEEPRDPDKAADAVRRLGSMLAPGGLLWLTIPVGYNPDLERAVRGSALGLTGLTALRRHGGGLAWRQVDPGQTRDDRYDWLLYTAAAVLVGELRAPE